MRVGKKAAGKKNKFWVGRFSFIQFALEENLIFVTSLAVLHITKKYWRSAGNSKNFSSRIHKRSRCFFRLTKLWKKTIWKAAAKENFTNSMQNSSPHFANIMLPAVLIFVFFSIFKPFFVKICQNYAVFCSQIVSKFAQ